MYDIRQFRPALYFLLILGVSGFALAAESPMLWVVAVSGILLHIWLWRSGRFYPLPRLVANFITIIAMVFVLHQLRTRAEVAIMTIGEFLVLLHLIKLFELRANRDYAQLIVLSLLLMVAAAINTASMVFGIMFLLYLFLSLHCCLLFHLKVETDSARSAQTLPPEKLNAATLQQDQRYLPRSMRRMTAAVSIIAIVSAVFVFLAFPRGSGAGMFGQLQIKPSQQLTGLSEQLEYGQVARIAQNPDIVAYVQVWKNDQVVQAETLRLRMLAYDYYERTRRQWSRLGGRIDADFDLEADKARTFGPRPGAAFDDLFGDQYRQRIRMQPTGIRAIGAIAGLNSIQFNRDMHLQYRLRDETLASTDGVRTSLDYDVISAGQLHSPAGSTLAELVQLSFVRRLPIPIDTYWRRAYLRQMMRGDSQDPDELKFRVAIADYARRPDVAGKVIADFMKDPHSADRDLAAEVADAIQNHLRTQFTYTLDLTDASRIKDNEDPIVKFLYEFKRGHCEYFAGAMALLCQSVGIRARVITGFACDEYNTMGNYYIVRQSNAHAWVEVLTGRGWVTYDPTSGREAPFTTTGSVMSSVSHFFNFLQFKWAESIITYGNNTRNTLFVAVNDKVSALVNKTSDSLSQSYSWLHAPSSDSRVYQIAATIFGSLLVLMLIAIIVRTILFLIERWRLRKRAARIGVDGLPDSDRRRILRQLGFYDDFTRALARHGVVRRSNQTQLEFVRSLTFLPPEVFDAADRVTRVFYRIRFGRSELDPGRQRRMNGIVSAISAAMDRLSLQRD